MDPEMDLVMGPETGPDMDEPRRRGGVGAGTQFRGPVGKTGR